MARSFRGHVTNYAWAEMAGAAMGLLSFPILTRLLSVSEYGTMNLVASVLGLTVALGKMGVQHAAMRTWSEVQSGRSPYTRPAFESTVIWGMAASGGVVMVLWWVAAFAIPHGWWGAEGVRIVMLLASPLIVVRVLESALVNQLRAREASGAMAVYTTTRRAGVLVSVVGVLWALGGGLQGFYLAMLAAEALAMLALMTWMFQGSGWPAPSAFSRPLYVGLAVYGLPMLGSELANVVLTMSDRSIIQARLGAESLGLYAASYNMCDQLRSVLLGAMAGAAYPRCMKLWESEGEAGLRRFLGEFLHHYIALSAYVVALMAVAGPDLLSVLASSKYAAGGAVAGWIMAALAVQTVISIAAVGIYLAKRTLLVMVLMLAACVLSVTVNWWLVPVAGIRGAAWSALGAYLLLAAAQMLLARQIAPVVVPWRSVLRFAPPAAGAALLALQLDLHRGWANLFARSAVYTALFVAAAMVLDPGLRRLAMDRWTRWRAARSAR